MNKIAIWDADFIPFYVCHVKKDYPEKSFTDCVNLSEDLIYNINTAIGADTMIMCFTSGKCFRYNIYPEYKANRKYGDPPKHLFEIKDYLISKYKGVVYKDIYEADDLVCILKNKLNNYKCTIVSPDKDMLMLEGIHYNPKTNEWVTTTEQQAIEYFWKSMIHGDTADNLCGIKGIGKVGADKIINNKELFEDYNTLILKHYIKIYGEDLGIEMYYKMYKCLKIIDKDDTVEIPELIEVKNGSCEEERLFS